MMKNAAVISPIHYSLAGEVAAFIQENCSNRELISIKNLTQHFGICSTRLSSSFRFRYQISVHAFAVKVRMEKARRLICEQSMSIKAASIELKYQDLGNFSRDFKKVLGYNPKGYLAEVCSKFKTNGGRNIMPS